MGDDLDLPERQCARTPMQWSAEAHGGFTESSKPILPVISDGAYGFEHVNAATQRRDPESMLNWMERVIRMRKEVPEIGWGDFSFLRVNTDRVLAMRYEWRNNSVVFLHNLGAAPCEVQLRLPRKDSADQGLVNLLSEDHSLPTKGGTHRILLEPYGYRWYRVGGLDYLLRQSEF
jgi:maltose alpha-D-glucosyltransferase/alpha-amylase